MGTVVWVAALGYFVDIYDLLLFGIVRVPSLRSLGLSEEEILRTGILLVNLQMTGMLLGGLLWGVIGDKKGRVSVLFGSILIYSLANLFNAFVSSVEMYGFLRFMAGIGLAGELGAAITLVSETLKKEHRGYGTTLVAGVGILGAVVAGIVGDLCSWKTAYLIGGIMGILLLLMRLSIFESGMFEHVRHQDVRKGDLRMLFYPWSRFSKYMRCILVGVPIWFVVGILITFSPELAKEMGIVESISAGRAILFCYLGGAIGNFFFGLFSQYLKSRKKAITLSLTALLALVVVFLYTKGMTAFSFYFFAVLLGFATGYWVVFMTLTAEQFGTNLRATVTTTVPNFVRGSVVVLTVVFQLLQAPLGLVSSALAVGLASIGVAFLSVFRMQDTFGQDLDYLESA